MITEGRALQAGFLVVAGTGALVLAAGDVVIGQRLTRLIDTSLNVRVTRCPKAGENKDRTDRKNNVYNRFMLFYLSFYLTIENFHVSLYSKSKPFLL